MRSRRERLSDRRDEVVFFVIGLIARLASRNAQRMITRYVKEGVERDIAEVNRLLTEPSTIDNDGSVN